jgi:hypothetical protein
MARGWESKSVESQVEARADLRKARTLMPNRTPEQMEMERKSDSLLLQRVRVMREIESSSNARHRKTLEDGLKYLEDSLGALGWKK